MERYDYYEAVKQDAEDYIVERMEYANDELTAEQIESLYDDAFVADSVTGNASGSYTFSRWQAEENICHNMLLAGEAYEDFGYDGIADDEAERIDVTIRCYVLGQIWSEAVENALNRRAIELADRY